MLRSRTVLRDGSRALIVLVLAVSGLALGTAASSAAPATMSTTSLAFGSHHMGTSTQKSVTVKPSLGYHVQSLSESGSLSSWSLHEAPDCSSGGPTACTIAVTFAPAAVGALNQTVTILVCGASLADCASYHLALTGTGVAPATLSPTSLSFGSVAIGKATTKPVVVKLDPGYVESLASPDTSGPFSASPVGDTCAVPGPASCTLDVTFAPSVEGAVSQTILISVCTTPADPCAVLRLPVTGTGTAAATISPTSISFGSVHVGRALTKPVTVTVPGSYHIDAVTALNGTQIPFSTSALPTSCTSPGPHTGTAACKFSAIFAPRAIGTQSGTLVVHACSSGNTNCRTYGIKVGGVGVAPASTSVATLGFGSIPVYTTKTLKLVVTLDPGWRVDEYDQDGIDHSAEGFNVDFDPSCSSAAPKCTIPLTFAPQHAGAYSETDTVSVCDAHGCVSLRPIKVTGTATLTATTTKVAASAASVTSGTVTRLSVVVTPTVSRGPDSGTITFYDGGTAIPACANLPVYTDDAGESIANNCNVVLNGPGKHTITAVYSGTPGYRTSTSASVVVTVVARS